MASPPLATFTQAIRDNPDVYGSSAADGGGRKSRRQEQQQQKKKYVAAFNRGVSFVRCKFSHTLFHYVFQSNSGRWQGELQGEVGE